MRIEPREWRWVLLVSCLVLLASSLPVIAGTLAQTPEWSFAGTVYDVQDYNSHLAKMQLGAHGELLYRSLFTTEDHPSEAAVLPYVWLGFLASRLGIPLPIAYQLGRLTGGLALLCSTYVFISMFFSRVSTRRLAFLLAVAASGLGWLLLKNPAFSYPNVSPIDFWLSDAYIFFSVMAFPHYSWAIAALLLSFVAWKRYCEDPSIKMLVILVALSSVHAFIQIFEIVVLDVVIVLDAIRRAIWDKRTLRASLAAGAAVAVGQGLVLWPYVHGALLNPMFRVWSGQPKMFSPPPHYYVLGYGLLLLFAIIGAIHALENKQRALTFPVLWLAAVALLVYAPSALQFRWLEGVQVPMAILAAVGLERVAVPWIMDRLPGKARRTRNAWLITALLIVAMIPSTLYVVAGNTLLAASHWSEAFLTGDEAAGIAWLGDNTDPHEPVLAAYEVGNAIPARIGHKVYYGHWAETMYYSEKSETVSQFFDGMQDEERRSLLMNNGIRYVFHGPSERELGSLDLASLSFLQLRFQDGDVAIYEVVHP